ncbi:M43 family zinc metalloprotease [Spirosoma pollinicola]|uniref:Ulilysin n=1 Tax=Spirosoma pollinicola TaxID=2057025 RepID=A0A2K8YZ08_9BACT|nr:M43 family zinc metalloprotease [Spirosoma pollinicola]AUD02829.1 Ulilysin [Spirosoma pollinicola]
MIKQVNNNLILNKRTGWRWLAGSFLSLLTLVGWAQTSNESLVNRCGVVDHERILQQRNPNRLRQLNELNRLVQQAETNQKSLRLAVDSTVYRIPVVVHVVHSNASNTIGGTNNVNISDEQIISQIQVLNEDYRRKAGTNGFNTSPIGTDARIEFYLATADPDGKVTTGITRNYYAQKTSFNVFNDDVLLSQIAYWPSNRYLNIWVTRIDTYIGYTQFPTMADTLKGLPVSSNEFTDGTIIDYRYFGRQVGTVNKSSLYALGRTATHEIGHWLGLLHTWGDGNGCNDDYVADTPPTADRSDVSQLLTCKQTYSTCVNGVQTRDLIEDYMNYWPDACMNLFTAGQVSRMRLVMTLSPRRAQLLKSVASPLAETEALTVNVYPNPASTDPSVDVQLKGFQSFSIDLFDAAGRQLRTYSYTDAPSTHVNLSVTGLASGVYIVRVKTGSEVASKRLLVQ